MNQNLIAEFDEAQLRLEKVVCLALQPYLALSDDAEELLGDDFDTVLRDTGIKTGSRFEDEDEDDPDINDRAEFLRMAGYTDLFVFISHAINGWGRYRQRWFYAPTVEAAAKAAIAHQWPAEKQHA